MRNETKWTIQCGSHALSSQVFRTKQAAIQAADWWYQRKPYEAKIYQVNKVVRDSRGSH